MKQLLLVAFVFFCGGCAGIPMYPPAPIAVGAQCPPGSRGTGEVEVRVHEFENRVQETVLCETPDGRIVRGRERVIQTPRTGRYAREYATDDGYVGVETKIKRNRRGTYEGDATYHYQSSPLFGITIQGQTGGGRHGMRNRKKSCRICNDFGCNWYEPYLVPKSERKKYCR